jgi:hypothetical protein
MLGWLIGRWSGIDLRPASDFLRSLLILFIFPAQFPDNTCYQQGDQIGQIFAQWAIVYSGQFV